VKRVVGVLCVALIATADCSSAKPLDVTASVEQPAGIATRTFAPPPLGATVTVPSTWHDAAPSSGFQYTLLDSASTAYLLASSSSKGEASIERFSDRHRDFLKSIGAVRLTKRAATVDNHGAVVLRYRLPDKDRPGATVDVVEYDVARGSMWVIVALGETSPGHSDALFRWIASTIKIAPV
jgi:hypothetical protein